MARKGQGVAARRQKQLSECAVLLPLPHRSRAQTPARARSTAAAVAAVCPSSPPTDNPLLRLDPQSSTPENVPPSWMSRDRPAANRRPLMSGRAPCRRLINRPELHRQRPVQLRESHPGQTCGNGTFFQPSKSCRDYFEFS